MAGQETVVTERFSADEARPLPTRAETRRHLEQAQFYWLATARPDGRPHVMPILAVWLDGGLYFRIMHEDLQQHVQDAVDQLVESGAERGLQVAVYRIGPLVVDAVPGVADLATGRPVTSDTPFLSYSINKGVASTVVHVHAEHGVLTYDTRIVELWPELGAHGKDKARIRQALSLSAGVRGLPPGLTVEELWAGV